MLQPELAGKIINEIRKVIGEDAIVASTDGTIIASTDPARTGSFHEGTLIAAIEKRKIIITQEDETKLKGVRAGINLPIFFQHDVVGIVGITGDPEAVTPLGEVIRKMTELLIMENYYSSQFEWQSRALEAFVADWLQAPGEETLMDRARLLGIDMALERMAAIIAFRNISQPLSRETWSALFSWPHFSKTDVVTRWGNSRIVVLLDHSLSPARDEIERKIASFCDFTEALAGITPVAGIGQSAPAGTIKESYFHAGRALKNAGTSRKVVFDEDLTLEMLIDGLNAEIKIDFVRRTIGPILEEVDLLETLAEFFRQNKSFKKTAEQMHIHINTLHYRLKKIEEMTKLNPGRTSDFTAMFLAMLFLDKNTNNNLI
ncbi:carbohydrate diacid regulator [Neobacillus piezotolerans]|uniref:Carbohydrate diacid regulator n=1 Tax=Neobacillus piezotolerans TaxID=2259171 RepID=A0A3D8GV60_9BACI|nr:sugar diacid recognition domain-containing protein [Neobacillus piezotolerans]RDU38363.1 carbohydrate diacid regulator [Neobacillus piezotolerans]